MVVSWPWAFEGCMSFSAAERLAELQLYVLQDAASIVASVVSVRKRGKGWRNEVAAELYYLLY